MENGNTQSDTQKQIVTDTVPIILRIPKDSILLEITSHFVAFNDDCIPKIQKCHASFQKDDIEDFRHDFLDNVESGDDYDAVYELTPEAKKEIDALEAKYGDEWINHIDEAEPAENNDSGGKT
jgi:hypothetical protein